MIEGNPPAAHDYAHVDLWDACVERLAQEVKHEGKIVQFMAPTVCMCSTMQRIDPQHLAWCLENRTRLTQELVKQYTFQDEIVIDCGGKPKGKSSFLGPCMGCLEAQFWQARCGAWNQAACSMFLTPLGLIHRLPVSRSLTHAT